VKLLFALLVPGLAALALATPASATTYPRTCGKTTWKGTTYVIRTHLLTCSKGKPYAINYLRKRKRPAGWKCTNGKSGDSIKFVCRRKRSSFLTIRT
jgi:hypothetical protein